jgi:hypothetical protein
MVVGLLLSLSSGVWADYSDASFQSEVGGIMDVKYTPRPRLICFNEDSLKVSREDIRVPLNLAKNPKLGEYAIAPASADVGVAWIDGREDRGGYSLDLAQRCFEVSAVSRPEETCDSKDKCHTEVRVSFSGANETGRYFMMLVMLKKPN